jgi:small subunit ribosomal protein S15
MLTQKAKQKVIETHRVHETDSGSSEVQVALLSEEILRLISHLKKHPKDFSSKRGLLRQVAKRRTLLAYLRGESPKRYAALAKKLGLKTA